MTARSITALVLAVLLALADTATAETIYKWVDDQGITHYGDEPPSGTDAQRIEASEEPSSSETERAQQQLETTTERLEERRRERLEERRAAQREQRKREQREKRCQELRQALRNVKRNRNLIKPDGEGGYEAMTEQERQKRVAERRKRLKKQCE